MGYTVYTEVGASIRYYSNSVESGHQGPGIKGHPVGGWGWPASWWRLGGCQPRLLKRRD